MGAGIKRVVVASFAAAVFGVAGAPAASAQAPPPPSPWWHLSSGARPSYLPPGGSGEVVATVVNVGDTSTTEAGAQGGPVTIVDRLPAGLRAVAVEGAMIDKGEARMSPFPCSLETRSAGEAPLAVCPVTGSGLPWGSALPPFVAVEVRVSVVVEAGARTGEENEVSVSGGGAPPASISRPVTISAQLVPFGVEDYELSPEEAGGSIDTQAGSHPFQTTFALNLNQGAQTRLGNGIVAANPIGLTRDLHERFPPGLIGNPDAVPRCTDAQFFASRNECPASSVVGVAISTVNDAAKDGLISFATPVFNLEPSRGEPARFGFLPDGREAPVYINASVRTGGDYGLTVEVSEISQAIEFVSNVVTFWGVPGNAAHDETRDGCLLATAHSQYPPCEALGENDPPPFFQLPASCTGPLRSSVEVDSWEAPGNFATGENIATTEAQPLPALDGCNKLPFRPEIKVTPQETASSTPSALNLDVHVPQEAAPGSGATTSADIRDIAIALPAGVALNPSGANGLEACTEAQVGFTGFGALDSISEEGGQTATFTPRLPEPLEQGVNYCPDAAKLGTVTIDTPILAQPLQGSIYLATQNANPFGSLVAVYIVAKDPETGVLVKLPGQVSLDQRTGQITTTFENTPQLPLEDIDLEFFGGELAPLAMPPHCGTYTTTALLTPWSGEAAVPATSSFEITSGPQASGAGTSGCPSSPLPFAPSMTAGTTSIQAGGYSPLTMTISRPDGEQAIQSVRLKLPPGLSGILAGVPPCQEAQANAGTCGPESLIGETTLSAGLGGDPATIAGGRVYLTGPYNGTGSCTAAPSREGFSSSGCAPFGLSIAVPAKVGPFTLQEGRPIVVRAKLEVDPVTAALTIATGTIPTIVEGFPLQVKDLNITIGRPGFIFNPTSCARQSIAGTIAGDEGAQAPVSSSFQATNCASLKFTPKLTALTRANGELQGHGASLHIVITTATSSSAPAATSAAATTTSSSASASSSTAIAISSAAAPTAATPQANIRSLKLDLPQRLPARLETIQKACPESTFDANPAGCPKASVVGSASVQTAILASAMAGPAYFVSHGNEAFPQLILVLQGYGITIDLVGDTFISKAGITSSTFAHVPDAPVSSFELTLPQGKFSALTANANLCTVKGGLKMPTEFVGQNGAVIHQSTPISVSGCPKVKALTSSQKLKAALKACHKKKGSKRSSCERTAHKRYDPIKHKPSRKK